MKIVVISIQSQPFTIFESKHFIRGTFFPHYITSWYHIIYQLSMIQFFLMKLLSNKFFSSYLVRVSYIRKPYRLISGRKKIQHAITNYNVITNKSSRFYESIIFLRRVNFYIILHASCIILYVSNIALNFILAMFSIKIFSLITYCSKQIDKMHLIGLGQRRYLWNYMYVINIYRIVKILS